MDDDFVSHLKITRTAEDWRDNNEYDFLANYSDPNAPVILIIILAYIWDTQHGIPQLSVNIVEGVFVSGSTCVHKKLRTYGTAAF